MFNKQNRFIMACLVLILVLFSGYIGCAEYKSYESESLKKITLSPEVDKQLNAVNATAVFSVDTKMIYCSFNPYNLKVGTRITARWIYVKGEAKELSNYIIEEWNEIIKKEGRLAMFIRCPANGWPKGSYSVVLIVDDREEIKIPFTVR